MTKEIEYQPLFARVLIEREVQEKVGSIIIPDSQKMRQAEARGTVIAVGPTADPSIQVGDKVIFGKNAGSWLAQAINSQTKEVEGKYFICADEDILCKVVK